MTEPREIMAKALVEVVWGDAVDAKLDSWRTEADACLAALTAAGFEVRRAVEREALRERIEQALDPFVCSTGHLMSVYPGNVVNAVLVVLDTPTEEGNE